MGKVYTDSAEAIVLLAMNLEAVERKQLISFAEEVGSDIALQEKAKTGGLVGNVSSLKILEGLNAYLLDVNEGKTK